MCGFDRDPESVVSRGAGESNHSQRKVQIALVLPLTVVLFLQGLKVKLQSFLLPWAILFEPIGRSKLIGFPSCMNELQYHFVLQPCVTSSTIITLLKNAKFVVSCSLWSSLLEDHFVGDER